MGRPIGRAAIAGSGYQVITRIIIGSMATMHAGAAGITSTPTNIITIITTGIGKHLALDRKSSCAAMADKRLTGSTASAVDLMSVKSREEETL